MEWDPEPREGQAALAHPGEPVRGDVPGTENVEGKLPVGLEHGFGETWRKRFRVVLPHQPSPASVMRTWKAEFNDIWPRYGRFFHPSTGIRPGEVAGFELDAPVGLVSSGVVITQADDTSFSLLTPQGHMFAGWLKFAVLPANGGAEARIDMAVRPSDPLYQLGMWLGGYRSEDRFWKDTLRNLALRFGEEPRVSVYRKRTSRRFSWRNAANVRHNAAVRTTWQRFRRPASRLLKTIGWAAT